MTKSAIGGPTTLSSKAITTVRIPGALELHFTLFDQPYTVILERIRAGQYRVMLDGDILGQIDRSGNSWSTPMGIATRSSDVAAYVTTLWFLLGKERGEL